MYHGLSFAWNAGARDLVCYSDSLMAVKLAGSPIVATHLDAAIIAGIQELLCRDWDVELRHTLREGNGSADVMAKLGASQAEKFTVIATPPASMGNWLRADTMRVPHLRD